jgi:preprotein translocase subunit YajC
MNLIISTAWAADPAPPANGGLIGFLPLILIFVIFYFLLIRPQSKRAKEHKAMITALAKGDEVVTAGGILGRITELAEQHLTLEIADGVEVKIERHTVQKVLPKGTLKV